MHLHTVFVSNLSIPDSDLSHAVDKLLSNEDGGGIFDDPPAITEGVMMPQDHGDDDDDFDALSGQFHMEHEPEITSVAQTEVAHIPKDLDV